MLRHQFPSISDQVAQALREGMRSGRWKDVLPGRDKLVKELGVSGNSVETALRQLKREGLLDSAGPGRRRRILMTREDAPRAFRVGFFLFERADAEDHGMVDLRHRLKEAGHSVILADRTLTELHMDVNRVARIVEKTAVDAWVIISGSRDVLEWFSRQPTPAFARFGRRRGLPIAGIGPDKPAGYAEATRRLMAYGHQKIVLLTQRTRRIPQPGASERAFLDTLSDGGIKPGPYHMPDWDDTPDGFHRRLEMLFHITPPTALIIDEMPLYIATQQFLLHRGCRVPQDVSLVCTDNHPCFSWCKPSIAHIRWDTKPIVQRILRWTNNVSRGKRDRRQSLTKAEFVEGGSIGPAPSGAREQPPRLDHLSTMTRSRG